MAFRNRFSITVLLFCPIWFLTFACSSKWLETVDIFLWATAIIFLVIFIFIMLPSDIAWSRLLLASYNICFAIFTSSLVFAISLSNSLCFVSNLLHFFCSLFSEAFSCFFLFNSSFPFSSCFLFASSSSCFFAMCERWALYKASHVSLIGSQHYEQPHMILLFL